MEPSNKFKLRIFETVISVCMALLAASVGWSTKELIQHGKELESVKASRFTASDGLQVWREMAAIREAVAKLPAQFPPSDYAKMVDTRFAGMELRVARVEESLSSLTKLLQDNRVDIIAIRSTVELLKERKP